MALCLLISADERLALQRQERNMGNEPKFKNNSGSVYMKTHVGTPFLL